MKTNLLLLSFATLLLVACNSIVHEQDLLMGQWNRIVRGQVTEDIVQITDKAIIYANDTICTYSIQEPGLLHVTRSWLAENNPAHEADCQYWFQSDTLTITNMMITAAAIYPPLFADITLIKSTYEK